MSSPTEKPSQLLPPTPGSTSNPSLPDDLLLSCFARVSALYYPIISFASKSFGSLIASPELYHTRSLLHRTESRLYLCLQFPTDPNPRWFTLCCKPDRSLEKEKKMSSGYALAPTLIHHPPPADTWSFVAVGSDIYRIGGLIDDAPSSRVSILDCRLHKWRKAPSMRVARDYPAACVFDGKIYVAGGCRDSNSSNLIEVFDPKTQNWELVVSPLAEECGNEICKSAVIDGEIYMFGKRGMVYNPEEDTWEMITLSLGSRWSSSYCVIGNILYSYSNVNGISWFSPQIGFWEPLMGLEDLPEIANYGLVRLVNFGGKMVGFWDCYLPDGDYENKMIKCAVIVLEWRKTLWGKFEWIGDVLKVPESYEFVSALAATV